MSNAIRLVGRFSVLSLLAAAVALWAGSAHAGTVYWDGGTVDILTDGDGASDGGAGTWDITIFNWDAGVAPHVAWINGNNDTAVLGGTAGTVTLGAGITAGGLTFGATDYILAGANTLTLGGASPTASEARFRSRISRFQSVPDDFTP